MGSRVNLQSLEDHDGSWNSTPIVRSTVSTGLHSIEEQLPFDVEHGHTNETFKGLYNGYGHRRKHSMAFMDSPESDPLSNYRDESIYTTKKDNSEMRQAFSLWHVIQKVLHQIPAIALIAIFHLMIGISYFPIGWRENHHPFTFFLPTSWLDKGRSYN